jgi:hypothetical protein
MRRCNVAEQTLLYQTLIDVSLLLLLLVKGVAVVDGVIIVWWI